MADETANLLEDQGIYPDFCDDETDDVFFNAIHGESEKLCSPRITPSKQAKTEPSKAKPSCPIQWSVSHRCLHCDWKKQRGGRPDHPRFLSLFSENSPPMVTLQSLGTRDSGYEPSPTSVQSFSYSFSSEDEADMTDSVQNVSNGVTPPINIPSGRRKQHNNGKRTANKENPPQLQINPKQTESCLKIKKKPKAMQDFRQRDAQTGLRRSRSFPELGSKPLIPKTPIIIREDQSQLLSSSSATVTPLHGRNYSLPATTPDGRPLLTPPSLATAHRASREGLIDLTEDDPEGSSGHRRRVLVFALPDIVKDVESGHQNLDYPSSNDDEQEFCGPRQSYNDIRPSWRRPRSLSCDVTLEVQFGQELRKIADNFTTTKQPPLRDLLTSLRNRLRRRSTPDETLERAALRTRLNSSAPSYNHGTEEEMSDAS